MSVTPTRNEDARAAYLHTVFVGVERAVKGGKQVRTALLAALRPQRVRFFRNGRLSFPQAKRLFYRWRKARTPEILRRRYKPGVQPRSTEFVDAFLRRLDNDASVSARDLHRQYETEWQNGRTIPGFGTWRQWCKTKRITRPRRGAVPPFPVSYSTLSVYVRTSKPHEYRRLHRKLMKAKADLAKFIDGRRAALANRRRQIDANAHFPVSNQ